MSNFDRAAFNRAGKLFVAANVSAKSVIAVTTGMTGVIIANPPGSGKKALIASAGWAWTTVPGAVHNIGFALAAPHPTALSSLTAIGSGVLTADGSGNAGSAACRVYDAATLPVAPVVVRWMFGAAWGSGVGVSPHALIDDIDGAIILNEGVVGCFAAVTTTAIGLGSICWAEVDA